MTECEKAGMETLVLAEHSLSQDILVLHGVEKQRASNQPGKEARERDAGPRTEKSLVRDNSLSSADKKILTATHPPYLSSCAKSTRQSVWLVQKAMKRE